MSKGGKSYYNCYAFKFIREYLDKEVLEEVGMDLPIEPRFRVRIEQGSEVITLDDDDDIKKLIKLLQDVVDINDKLKIVSNGE